MSLPLLRSGLFEWITAFAVGPAVRISLVAIGPKDKPVTFLLAGARDGLPSWIDKLRGIPGDFVFTRIIGLRWRSMMPAFRISLVAIRPKDKVASR